MGFNITGHFWAKDSTVDSNISQDRNLLARTKFDLRLIRIAQSKLFYIKDL